MVVFLFGPQQTGVGDVCGFAMFDFVRHGDPSYSAPMNDDLLVLPTDEPHDPAPQGSGDLQHRCVCVDVEHCRTPLGQMLCFCFNFSLHLFLCMCFVGIFSQP